MWAYRLVAPGVFEVVEVPAPASDSLESDAVLLRTLAGGICGSDIPKLIGRTGSRADGFGRLCPGRPGFPMHEVVGEVLASRHPGIRVGARVVGWASRSDALAEYVITDGNQLHVYSTSLSPVDAVLIQPLACVLEALDRVAVADRVVGVIGLGPIGLLFAHVAKSRGARRVVGVDPVDRGWIAANVGIDDLVTAPSRTWARAVVDANRPAVVIEAVGHQVSTLDDAISAVAVAGSVLYFGIPDDEYYPLNMERLLRNNLGLFAGITRERHHALARADDYLAQYPELNGALVSHRFDIDSVQRAYDTAATTDTDRLKVVVSHARDYVVTPRVNV
ncbi:zinc-binding dehydrogenase [Mycobacterium sp. URHB0021]|jgi:L-iditol 2-dehydrogenase